jgi:hypothetical protein
MRIWLVALALVLAAVAPARGAWRRPVTGAVARPFAYEPSAPFRAGAHRGVDLAAPPGSAVRAACSGIVVTARWRVVTLRCGPWRVTHLPLAAVSVRTGTRVRAGEVVGRLGTDPAHAGLHLGVRRADDRFAYVDPLPFLTRAPSPPPVAGAPRIPREGPRPSPFRAPLHAAQPARVRVFAPARARALAPWPAWAGLALLLLGAVGGGLRFRARRRPAPLAQAVAEGVPSAP